MDSHEIPVGKVEARSVAFTDLEVTKQGRHFDGYAAIYGEETDIGEFIEVILPPAFRSALAATSNLPMLWDHNAAMPPFATTKAGTLKVSEDRRGLRVSADIDERHILGPTLISMAERGEVEGMSFGFVTGRGDNKVSERNGRVVRAITGFRHLLDVSPTWNPAYPGTSAELRSLSTLGASVLVPEQVHDGEPESAVDGPDSQQDTEKVQAQCETCGQDPCTCEAPEEQRSGADADTSAARKRRLQMMGLSLPR
jgi:HK97 family phage prohead protease